MTGKHGAQVANSSLGFGDYPQPWAIRVAEQRFVLSYSIPWFQEKDTNVEAT